MRITIPSSVVVAAMLITIACRVRAADAPAAPTTAPAYQDRVDRFWTLLESGKTGAALAVARPDDMADEDYIAFQARFEKIIAAEGGRCAGHYKLNTESFGHDITTVFYVALYEKLPVVVDMTFYNFEGKWKCISTNVNARATFFRDVTRSRFGATDDARDADAPDGSRN